MNFFAAILAAVVVGTWNARWFPSGEKDRRAPADVEAAAIADAGLFLSRGLSAVDPCGTNDVILCLNEIRDAQSASALADAIGRTNLTLAIITAYRWRDRADLQQDAILTTLPLASKNWSYWKHEKGVRPPRGFAHAEIVLTPAVTASVYAVHLKANSAVAGGEAARENRAKRGAAVRQVVAMTKRAPAAVVAGDFNSDPSRAEFRDETLFADLAKAGYGDPLMALPRGARETYSHAWRGGRTLDHICLRGLGCAAPPRVIPAGSLSDHNPVFVLVRAP